MDYQVDLHMHTVASDGTQTSAALLEEVIEKNIKIFAITDHDSVESLDEMIKLVGRTDRIFIPGVEISTTYQEKEIHLLTYGLRADCQGLMDILAENQKVRMAFNHKIIEHVEQKDERVSLQDYLEYERDPSWGGWKAENYLRDIGAIHHLGELFAMLHDMDEKMIFSASIEMIPRLKGLGAKVVLAHPPAYYGGDLLSIEMLEAFKDAGIDGIECFSPYYKEDDQSDYYLAYCQENDLMITCGSDYHGAFISTRHMGIPRKYKEDLQIDKLLMDTPF